MFGIRFFTLLGVLVFLGVVAASHFLPKPTEKNVVVRAEEEVLPRARTAVETTRYFQELDETIQERRRKLEKDFNISINSIFFSQEEKVAMSSFIGACYENPVVAKEIGSLLRGVRIMFSSSHSDVFVGVGYISFPSTEEWKNPEYVPRYLKGPYIDPI